MTQTWTIDKDGKLVSPVPQIQVNVLPDGFESEEDIEDKVVDILERLAPWLVDNKTENDQLKEKLAIYEEALKHISWMSAKKLAEDADHVALEALKKVAAL